MVAKRSVPKLEGLLSPGPSPVFCLLMIRPAAAISARYQSVPDCSISFFVIFLWAQVLMWQRLTSGMMLDRVTDAKKQRWHRASGRTARSEPVFLGKVSTIEDVSNDNKARQISDRHRTKGS